MWFLIFFFCSFVPSPVLPSSPFPPPTSSPPTSTTAPPSQHYSFADPTTNPLSSPLPIAIDENTNIAGRRALSCYKSSHCTILSGWPAAATAAASSPEASDAGESSRSTAIGSRSGAPVVRSKSITVARHRRRASTAVGDEELIVEPLWRSEFDDGATIGVKGRPMRMVRESLAVPRPMPRSSTPSAGDGDGKVG